MGPPDRFDFCFHPKAFLFGISHANFPYKHYISIYFACFSVRIGIGDDYLASEERA